MLYGNIRVHCGLGLCLIHTPLNLKAFRQGKRVSAVARGCFQRSPEAVTFGQEAEKNTIIDTGCFPVEGLEIHCPSFLLLRFLCFHISRSLSYRTFFLSVFSFLFLLLSSHRMFHFLLSLLLYFLLFFQCLFSMFLLCFLSMKLILNRRKQGRCPIDDSVLAVPKLPKLCYLKVCIHILQNFQFSHVYCLLLWYLSSRPTCIIKWWVQIVKFILYLPVFLPLNFLRSICFLVEG